MPLGESVTVAVIVGDPTASADGMPVGEMVTVPTGEVIVGDPTTSPVPIPVGDREAETVTAGDPTASEPTMPVGASVTAAVTPGVPRAPADAIPVGESVAPPVTACPSHDHAGSSQVTVGSSQVAPSSPKTRVRVSAAPAAENRRAAVARMRVARPDRLGQRWGITSGGQVGEADRPEVDAGRGGGALHHERQARVVVDLGEA